MYSKLKGLKRGRFGQGIRKVMTVEVMIRVIIDAVAINIALIVAFLGRFLAFFWMDGFPSGGISSLSALSKTFMDWGAVYAYSALLLTPISLIIFLTSGFYTKGRAYRSRYKALVVFSAVTLSYLVANVFVYLLRIGPNLPRSIFILGWGLTILTIGGLRFSKDILVAMGIIEPRPRRKARKKVENVLVVGGAGYIGSVLVRKLLKAGYHVTVLDRLLYGVEPIKELLDDANFSLIKGDFRNIEAIVNSMQDIDAVIHLGALVGDPACAIDEKLTMEVNLASTRMIAETAKGYGVQRFLFASTCSVYGASSEELDEHSALHPLSLYAKTKLESEKILLSFQDEGFSPTIFRLATVQGFSQRPRFDLVVNLLAAKAAVDKKITIFGGNQWRPFVHVEDVADAFIRALEVPIGLVKGVVLNLGSTEENYQIRMIGEAIKELFPDVKVETRQEETDPRNYKVRFDRIEKFLGFTAKKTVIDGIQEIRDAINSGKVGDYTDPQYSNYKYLSDADNLTSLQKKTSLDLLRKISEASEKDQVGM